MTRGNIRVKDCKDKYLYAIKTPTSDLGVYIASKRAFLTLQSRSGCKGLLLQYHEDVGADVGEVEVVEELEEADPFDWDRLSLSPQVHLMIEYLNLAEKRYDIEFRRILRHCKELNADAKRKSGRSLTDNVIRGWCNGDKKLFDRVKKNL